MVSGKRTLTRDTAFALSMKLLPEEALHRATDWSSAGHCLLQRHNVNWAAEETEVALLVPLLWSPTCALLQQSPFRLPAQSPCLSVWSCLQKR